MIKTALKFKHSYKEICDVLPVTNYQIWWVKHHRLTPQKNKTGRHPLLHTPEKKTLKDWLLGSPSHRRVPWRRVPHYLPQLNAKEDAITTAFRDLGFCRRTSHRKGFSDDPRVIAERLAFAQDGLTWTRSRVQRIMFTDEVWAMGGAHTTSYVTVLEDGSDRYLLENLQHKYSKAPTWMFHAGIVDGKKGPAVFWDAEWGTINSERYDEHVLEGIQRFFQEHVFDGYIFMQDNAPSHSSFETRYNLLMRHIPTIKFPLFSPDLNIIEHVWNWMKNWIEEHYWEARYRVDKLSLEQLRVIIQHAWDAVPDDYIQSLFDSWWRRCQAVVDAKGGPTKY